MRDEIRSYVMKLFEGAPDSVKVHELKEELISNLMAKYDDLISDGRSEEEAYKITIGGIGDVNELLRGLENDKIYNYARRDAERRKSALIVACAVGLYIIAFAVQLLFGVFGGICAEIGTVLMFVIAAIATAMIVYNALSHPKYRKSDDTLVEEFKEWNHSNAEYEQIERSILSALWSIIIVVYFLISIYFNGWSYTWIIILIGIALHNILKLVLQIRRK